MGCEAGRTPIPTPIHSFISAIDEVAWGHAPLWGTGGPLDYTGRATTLPVICWWYWSLYTELAEGVRAGHERNSDVQTSFGSEPQRGEIRDCANDAPYPPRMVQTYGMQDPVATRNNQVPRLLDWFLGKSWAGDRIPLGEGSKKA